MAQLKCRECGNMYTAYTELGVWPVCPACKRAKEDQKEQKKQTEILRESAKREELRIKEEAARNRQLEEERRKAEQEKARRELEIERQKEIERKSIEAKKRINEISENILSKNKNMKLISFSCLNSNQFKHEKLFNEKEAKGLYLDLKELTGSNVVLDKIDLVGYKKLSDKWKNFIRYDNGKFFYYFSSLANEVEKIIFLNNTEISEFEKIISNIDDGLLKKEDERKKSEQAAKKKQEKEKYINNIITTAIKYNKKSTSNTNQQLLLLFDFFDALNKPLNEYNDFVEIFKNQSSNNKIQELLKQNEGILSILSVLDIKCQRLTKDFLIFENAIFGKIKKLDFILKSRDINKNELFLYLEKFKHINNFLPKTKKFIYSNLFSENIMETTTTDITEKKLSDKKTNESAVIPKKHFSTGIEYLDIILNSSKFIITIFVISIISSICFIAGILSLNFVALAIMGHIISLPLLIYIRFKHKIKILPVMILLIISFIFSLIFTQPDNVDVTPKTNAKIEKTK